jgi:hypothetical protein
MRSTTHHRLALKDIIRNPTVREQAWLLAGHQESALDKPSPMEKTT